MVFWKNLEIALKDFVIINQNVSILNYFMNSKTKKLIFTWVMPFKRKMSSFVDKLEKAYLRNCKVLQRILFC